MAPGTAWKKYLDSLMTLEAVINSVTRVKAVWLKSSSNNQALFRLRRYPSSYRTALFVCQHPKILFCCLVVIWLCVMSALKSFDFKPCIVPFVGKRIRPCCRRGFISSKI